MTNLTTSQKALIYHNIGKVLREARESLDIGRLRRIFFPFCKRDWSGSVNARERCR